MASITMDPPHVVNTGAACSTCCNLAPGKLLRCGACDSAWYCNQDCQRKNFKEHKPFCRALRLLHSLQKDLPVESWPRTARDFYVQRTNCQRILEPMLRRPLSRAELRAILGEAKCSVCMRTRSQLARSGSATGAPANGGPKPAPAPPTDGGSQQQQLQPSPAADPGADSKDAGVSDGAMAAATNGTHADGAAARSPNGAAAAAANGASPGVAASSTLSCCPHCHWGWVCAEHRDVYLAGPHAAVCLSYQHMNDSQLLTQRYLTATGRLPNYVPDKLRPTGQSVGQSGGGGGGAAAWEPVPSGWAAFQAWRPLPVFDQALMCLLTKRMSQALTVIQALQHHYTPNQLAARPRLEVHVLGASAFEVPADRVWEELLNLLPPPQPPSCEAPAGGGGGAASAAAGPRVLHVAFVGPELSDIIVEESDGRALPQGTALSVPAPEPGGRELLYSYHLCPYQDWAAGRRNLANLGRSNGQQPELGALCPWRPPDLAVAFNSGISEYDKPLWAPALQVLVRHGVPVVFTSYNGEEAGADAETWRAAGGEVTLGPERNPFRALEPIAEPSQVDSFYYQNYYWWCGRARGAK